jgi:hypothetical protein
VIYLVRTREIIQIIPTGILKNEIIDDLYFSGTNWDLIVDIKG